MQSVSKEDYLHKMSNEPGHDKMTKSTIRLMWPAKTQISLRIRAVWSVFVDRMCLLQHLGYTKSDKWEPLLY